MTSPIDPSTFDDVFRERLSREIEQWRREALIRPEQASALLARYGFSEAETPRSLGQSRIIGMLAVLGAILVGVGVIILIGANWQAMPRSLRVALILAAVIASYSCGWGFSHGAKRSPKVGMALLLLGSIIWGAGIFLIGQMYHAGGKPGLGGERQALLCWFAGVLPLGYVLPSPLHLCLAVLIGLVAIGTVLADAQASPALWMASAIAVGVVCYSVGEFHRGTARFSRLSVPLRWLGLAQVFIGSYSLSFRDLWRYEVLDYHWLREGSVSGSLLWQMALAFCALSAAAVLALLLTRPDRGRAGECVGLLLLAVVAAAVATAACRPTLLGISASFSRAYIDLASWHLMGAMNLILLGAAVGTVFLGWLRTDGALANLGIAVFSILIFTRYFDLLGSMLTGGFLFVGAGVLLLLWGLVLERSRRRLLAAMRERRDQCA